VVSTSGCILTDLGPVHSGSGSKVCAWSSQSKHHVYIHHVYLL
jgi:hypothetical protein